MINFINRTNMLRIETKSFQPNPGPRSAKAQMEKDLAEKIGTLLSRVPPRELARCVRDFMLLYLMDLKSIPPDFQKQVLDLMVLFEDLDRLEQESGS